MINRSPSLNRRQAVAAALTAPLVLPLSVQAKAESPMLEPSGLSHYRFKLGGFNVTTVSDGAVQLDGPHPIFGMNVEADQLQDLAEENFLPRERFEISFTPVIVNTGDAVIMFDTGNGNGRRPSAGKLAAALAQVGYTPDQIDIVVLTHFHPDHIGGLMENGAPLFANARYVTHETEYNFWTHPDRMSGGTERVAKLVESNVRPLAEKMSFIKDGDSVAGGITAVAAHGHTPGHTAYHIESEGQQLLLGGDFCNHYVVSLQRPDWHVRFDMDKQAAVETRKKVLSMLAADKIPFTSYHMPFPAVGYVEAVGESYRYVPVSYQMNL